MHHRMCALVLLLGAGWLLGPSSRPAAAQFPLPKDGVINVYFGATREVMMSSGAFIKAARSENPKIATVVLRKDDPRVALVTGLSEGLTRVLLTDIKDRTEEYNILVTRSDQELALQSLQRMAEQRRLALESMIKQTVPTANVQVLVFGYTVVLKGMIARAEDAEVIMELARSVYPE